MRKYWHTTNKYLWDANILDVGDSIFYDLSDCPSIGDTLCSTPTIKKVSEAYNCKVNVISQHPEIFKNAAKASGFLPSECIVIEDSTNGITAAKSAGIYCVGYNSVHSKNQSYDGADLIITNFSEISFDKITAFFNRKN